MLNRSILFLGKAKCIVQYYYAVSMYMLDIDILINIRLSITFWLETENFLKLI